MKLNQKTAWVGGLFVACLGACADDGNTSTFDGPAILFVTQVPSGSYGNVLSPFDNHEPFIKGTPRGGALMLRSGDGKLRNLTQEAGFGDVGMQGANAIAVREPTVHWDGDKALFSMVVGAPAKQFDRGDYHWQIYEVSGLTNDPPCAIRKIKNQPDAYNNVSPIYASDDRILFTTDRPRDGSPHLYPQLDEYESGATITGLWSLDEDSGALTLLDHTASGLFNPFIDSFGRVLFTRWDHLQRDQQADTPSHADQYKPLTWASEASDAATTTTVAGSESFPEVRVMEDPEYDPALTAHGFNHFFPWELNQDGTGEETLNHVGRHELGGSYEDPNFIGDTALSGAVYPELRANTNMLQAQAGLFQMKEDPNTAGRYYATFSPEFSTGTAGYIMRIDGAPNMNPVDMALTLITPAFHEGKPTESAGYLRDATPLSNGELIAVHTDGDDVAKNNGSDTNPDWTYNFRLRQLDQRGATYVTGAFLTDGIKADLTWFTPDETAHWSGDLWELSPVEVRKRPRPPAPTEEIEAPEQGIFDTLGLAPDRLRDWLRQNELALIISRNVTQRDRADRLQPYNLRVPGGVTSDTGSGKLYDVSHMQVFQADQVRGYGDPSKPSAGRRVLARPMHAANTTPAADGIAGAVRIGTDGSVAAFVPAKRALSWQLINATEPVVRERNWVSFQAGEIRVCAVCHGINKLSQTMQPKAENPPNALKDLLIDWIAQHPN
jgi:hypothetical protein